MVCDNGTAYLIKEDAAVLPSTLHQIFLATRVESDIVGDVVDFSCNAKWQCWTHIIREPMVLSGPCMCAASAA